MGETAFKQPGQEVDPPNLGNLVWLAGAVVGGCSNRLDTEVEIPLEKLVAALNGGTVFVSLGAQRTWKTPLSVLTNVPFPPWKSSKAPRHKLHRKQWVWYNLGGLFGSSSGTVTNLAPFLFNSERLHLEHLASEVMVVGITMVVEGRLG